MTESVEQAALRRAAEPTDWTARANREAAAIIAETMPWSALPAIDAPVGSARSYKSLVTLVAIGWLQGAIYGSHETLGSAEVGFENLRATLAAL